MKPRIRILSALVLASAAASSPAQDRTLAGPVGGWNRAGMTDKSGELAVSYPYSLIDRGAQKNRTMIRGHLAKASNKRVLRT